MKHRFSKSVVGYCLLMCTAITVVVLVRAELTAGVITALVGLWGGELLLLCLKRVLGDRVNDAEGGREGAMGCKVPAETVTHNKNYDTEDTGI